MDMRDSVFNTIYDIATKDPNVVMMVADVDSFGISKFKKDFSNRFFNVGVAEQNLINVACGLALSGKKVFVCALAPFVTFRCFEQIKVNMCGMNLPIFIIGLGIGLSFGFDGPTHHTVCDIGVMNNIPELSIYNPSDSISSEYCIRKSYSSNTPSYIRVDKGNWKDLYDSFYNFDKGFSILNNFTSDDVIVSTGICTQYAMNFNSQIKIIDLFSINNFKKYDLIKNISRNKRIITYEEHVINSGIGSIISNLLYENSIYIQIKKIALPEKQCFINGDREYLHNIYNISHKKLREIIC